MEYYTATKIKHGYPRLAVLKSVVCISEIFRGGHKVKPIS